MERFCLFIFFTNQTSRLDAWVGKSSFFIVSTERIRLFIFSTAKRPDGTHGLVKKHINNFYVP